MKLMVNGMDYQLGSFTKYFFWGRWILVEII